MIGSIIEETNRLAATLQAAGHSTSESRKRAKRVVPAGRPALALLSTWRVHIWALTRVRCVVR